MTSFEVRAIGKVESCLTDLDSAPRQADEGGPEAWLVFEPEFLEGLRGLRVGQQVILIIWLHRARRDVLSVHPRGDRSRPKEGLFNTRSPQRPNPIGLQSVAITAIEGHRVRVRSLEVLDGTPIIDQADAQRKYRSALKRMKALVEAGAQMQQEVKDVGGGKLIALVTDADGNVIGLIQPGLVARYRWANKLSIASTQRSAPC